MQGEKAFEDAGLSLKIIPTPREISSSCGLSILTSMDNLEKAKELAEDGMVVDMFWKFITDEDGKKEATPIDLSLIHI